PRVVAVGGGTGLSSLLRGVKKYTGNIVAIVTVADDGGSSGRLRDEYRVLPPGDIRQCLTALAETEPLMTELFQHRFGGDGSLSGHSFGNLFITAMAEITGDFEHAIRESGRVLAVRGQIVPSTLRDVTLCAAAGTEVRVGESRVPHGNGRIDRVFLEPTDASVNPEAETAILDAELIVIGPGSLYTSILPNLLVVGLVEALRASPAVKVYVCNLAGQPGETMGYGARPGRWTAHRSAALALRRLWRPSAQRSPRGPPRLSMVPLRVCRPLPTNALAPQRVSVAAGSGAEACGAGQRLTAADDLQP